MCGLWGRGLPLIIQYYSYRVHTRVSHIASYLDFLQIKEYQGLMWRLPCGQSVPMCIPIMKQTTTASNL